MVEARNVLDAMTGLPESGRSAAFLASKGGTMTNVDRAQRLTALHTSQFAAALHEQRQFRVEQLVQLADVESSGANPYGSLEVTAALKRAAVHALTEIDAALERLHDGSYGRCTSCGRDILRERLEVLPAAALCMACQRRADEDGLPLPFAAVDARRRLP